MRVGVIIMVNVGRGGTICPLFFYPECNRSYHLIRCLSSSRTTAVTSDKETLTITLSIEPIHMREVGRSFGVRYNQGSGEYGHNEDLVSRTPDEDDDLEPDLAKRDTHSFDDVWTYGYTPDIEDRLTIFPFDGLSGDLLRCVCVSL